MTIRVDVDNGKYSVTIGDQGQIGLLRHGEEWATPEKFRNVFAALAYEVAYLRAGLREIAKEGDEPGGWGVFAQEILDHKAELNEER